ncbi:MAG: GNAT family N-acetyltransferase [Chitinophagaceae bacterium]
MNVKPHSNLFQQQALWQLMHPDVREIVFQEGDSELRFFYTHTQQMGLGFLRNPPLIPYVVPTWKNKPNNPQAIARIWKGALAQLPAVDVAEWHWHSSCGVLNVEGFETVQHHTRLLYLQEGDLWRGLKPAVQRQIKKGKRALEIQVGKQTQNVFNMHVASLKRQQKKPLYTAEQLNTFITHCYECQQGTCYTAIKNKEVVAAIAVVWDENTTYYMAGGSTDLGQAHGAMSYLLWQAIQDAQQRGCQYFDFEGSRHEGIDHFFAGFGAEKVNYTVFYKQGNWWYRLLRSIKRWFNA